MASIDSPSGFDLSSAHPTIDAPQSAYASIAEASKEPGLSLFWRTFFLLAALIAGSVLAWLKTLSALDFEPRALQSAHQISSMVNITRAALIYTHGAAEEAFRQTLASEEHLLILPKLPTDTVTPPSTDALSLRIAQELRSRVGPTTLMSPAVNGQPGMWVSFTLGTDAYWLRIEQNRVSPLGGNTWLVWMVVALLLSLAGAAILARLINKPIKQLWLAASRVREGAFDSFLDETAGTNEIREVNIGFNRMAAKIAQMDQDRAVMLAGISHDLRTPLARLRLESEMYVDDDDARAHMANDIEQLDRTIDKFLEYARPVPSKFGPVSMNVVVKNCLYALGSPTDIHVTLDMAQDLIVDGDETELTRIVNNLLENARRYGKSPGKPMAHVEISGRERNDWVVLRVRDRGPGVAIDVLPHLTKAFFRGDEARTSATGAGLGLAIVEKTIQRMGGNVTFNSPSSGGLAVLIRLNKAT
jgi:two-component system, OmpR family, osmolarity sensor histidine kinase EnvZ